MSPPSTSQLLYSVRPPLKLCHFFAGDGSAELRGFGIDLCQALAMDDDFLVNVTHQQCDINAGVLRDAQGDAFGDIGTESLGWDREVIATGRQGRSNIFAGGIRSELVDRSGCGIDYCDGNAGDYRAGIVAHSASKSSGILGS